MKPQAAVHIEHATTPKMRGTAPSSAATLHTALPALSPVQTALDATAPALDAHMWEQFKICPARLAASKLAPSCAATISVALVCTGIATGMPKECNQSCTICLPDYHGNATKTGTRSHLQLRTWERVPAFVPTPQIQMWEHVPTSQHPRTGQECPTMPPNTAPHASHPDNGGATCQSPKTPSRR